MRVAPQTPAPLNHLVGELVDENANARDGDHLIEAVRDPDVSDLQGIRERGYLRMAVAPDPLMIAYDGEDAIGVAIAIGVEMEKYLASLPDAGGTPMVVVPTPTPRAVIAESIERGRSDFTALTVSRARNEGLALTQPLIRSVNDVPVLGPDIGPVETLEDLTRVPIYVSENGRYARDLLELNAEREADGKRPFRIKLVDGRLDDFDLIELVEIGLLPATVASDFKARFWQTVYPSVAVREDLALTLDGHIAWAVRSENPELQRVLDGFAGKVKKGTLIGNVILNRFTRDGEWIENLNSPARARVLMPWHRLCASFPSNMALRRTWCWRRPIRNPALISHASATLARWA
ncbi:hypothetical protein [Sulfitobacter aestuariivivens]|uniref:hypothetical protein n=1 Tax=Sulfitobacter aestuariivivens TaxID=2766981 RepID=UPI00361F73A6